MAPKVLLFGSGAVGTIYVYLLLKAGCHVTAVCRSNYEAATKDGFHIDSAIYGKGLHIKPNVVRTCEEAASTGPYDYLIVSCKALPEARVAQIIAPAVTRGRTTITLLQNGIDIEQEYAEMFPENPLLSCVVYLPTTQTSPGYIEMGALEILEIGPYPSVADSKDNVRTSADQLVELLRSAGGNPHYYPNIQERRWHKLLLNAPWNPMCALGLSRDIALLAACPTAESSVRGVLGEVCAIAQALGHTDVDEAAAEKSLKIVTSRQGGDFPGIEPSMLVDVLWERRMEVEVILGNPVRIAQRLGVQVPRLEMLYTVSKALDEANRLRKPGRSLDMQDLERDKAASQA